MYQTLFNWLKNNENYIPDIVLQLRPTQPLRNIKTIDKCLDIFIKNRNKYDNLRTVVEFEKSPYKMYNIVNNQLLPLFTQINNIKEPYNQCDKFYPKHIYIMVILIYLTLILYIIILLVD